MKGYYTHNLPRTIFFKIRQAKKLFNSEDKNTNINTFLESPVTNLNCEECFLQGLTTALHSLFAI